MNRRLIQTIRSAARRALGASVMVVAASLVSTISNADPRPYVDYTIQSGDTLQFISMKHFGTTKQWYRIYKENQQVLPAPEKVEVGMHLRIYASKTLPFTAAARKRVQMESSGTGAVQEQIARVTPVPTPSETYGPPLSAAAWFAEVKRQAAVARKLASEQKSASTRAAKKVVKKALSEEMNRSLSKVEKALPVAAKGKPKDVSTAPTAPIEVEAIPATAIPDRAPAATAPAAVAAPVIDLSTPGPELQPFNEFIVY